MLGVAAAVGAVVIYKAINNDDSIEGAAKDLKGDIKGKYKDAKGEAKGALLHRQHQHSFVYKTTMLYIQNITSQMLHFQSDLVNTEHS